MIQFRVVILQYIKVGDLYYACKMHLMLRFTMLHWIYIQSSSWVSSSFCVYVNLLISVMSHKYVWHNITLDTCISCLQVFQLMFHSLSCILGQTGTT